LRIWFDRRLLKKLLLGAAALGALIAAGVAWGILSGALVRTVYRDRSGLAFDGDGARVRQVLWSPATETALGSEPVELVDAVQRLADSTRMVVVALPTERGDRDLYYRVRTPRGWSEPRSFGAKVNSPSNDETPSLSFDGSELWFASDRAGGLGGLDIWVSVRVDGEWTAPRHLGSRINSPYDDRSPAVHPVEPLLVFATNRPHGFLVTPPENWREVPMARWKPGRFHLGYAFAELNGERKKKWTSPSQLPEISGTGDDDGPAFAPDGRSLWFSSSRPGGSGGFDLWRSEITALGAGSETVAGGFFVLEPPENLGDSINSRAEELAPRILDHGFAILCERAMTRVQDAVLVESRAIEVVEGYEVAELPMDAIVANLGRISLLLVSSFSLFAVLVILLRTREQWTKSLLTGCGVIAVFAHLGLLYGFYFWRISSEILAMARQEPDLEVALETSVAASISVDVRRQAIDIAEPLSSTVASTPAVDASALAAPSPEAPSSRVESNLAARELTVAAAAISPAAADRSLDPAIDTPRADTSRRASVATVTAPLPEVERLETEIERAVNDPATTSLRIDLDLARSTTTQTAQVLATNRSSNEPESIITELATAAVRGPEPSPLLPSQSRATPALGVDARLPIPAQSTALNENPSEPTPARSTPASTSTDPSRETAALEPRLAARLPQPVGRWESQPQGLLPSIDRTAAEALPETILVARSRALPVASTRQVLPETLPIAEQGSAEPKPPLPSEPTGRAESTLAASATSPAVLRSTVDTLELRPISAASDPENTVTESALARLAPSSSPGALTAKIERVRGPEDTSDRPRLPDTAGGRTAADLVTDASDPSERFPSPAGSKASRTFTPAATTPPAPSTAAAGESAAAPPAAPAALVARVDVRPETLAESPLEREDGLRAGAGLSDLPAPTITTLRQSTAEATIGLSISAAKLPSLPEAADRRAAIAGLRSAESRRELADRRGGTAASEAAVARALEWLRGEQEPDGRWDTQSSGGYLTDVDSAVTGLVVLCFLGHNHVPGGGTKYSADVARAIDWLASQQDARGLLSGEDDKYTMYSHGIATLALSEAYILSKDEKLRPKLEKAARVILSSQNATSGGWRYQPEPPLRGDTSITGWQVLALSSLRGAGIEIPDRAFELARHWLDVEVGGGEHGGIYGYRGKEEPRVSMAAEGMYTRQLLGGGRESAAIEEAARYVWAKTRDKSHLGNLYLLYYGTLALHEYQGWIWEAWNVEVRDYLVSKQNVEGAYSGSWDPLDEYVETGGRVLATAFATLTLEVYYRYLPIFWAEN
jgi:hypothetical protein